MSNPAFSVVLVSPYHFQHLRRVIRHLRAQTIASSIELLIVAPARESLEDARPGELDGFWNVRILEAGPITSVDRSATLGVNQATAPFIAHLEDHAYPEPDWAGHLIQAFSGPFVAIACVLENANPATLWSHSNLLLSFGSWVHGAVSQEIPAVPGHNITFRRDFLLADGPLAPNDLIRESTLFDRLRARGGRFAMCAEARVKHMNSSNWPSDFHVRFNSGRLYAHHRALNHNWSLLRRLLYFFGSPLIPPLRFFRLIHDWKPQLALIGPRVYPFFFAGLCFDALGQAAGYVFGRGGSLSALEHYETHKRIHVTPAEALAMDE